MTARPGGAFGRGYTSRGESIVRTQQEGRQAAQKERVRQMASKNASDAFSATPGAEAPGSHKVEEPLNVGPRDALIVDGHNDEDYVPDVESKGYHVGMVRQPVSVHADARGNVTGFSSELPSKFAEQPTIEDLKAYHNEVESSDEWNEGVEEARAVSLTPEQTEKAKAALDAAPKAERRTSRRGAKGKTVGDEMESAANEG